MLWLDQRDALNTFQILSIAHKILLLTKFHYEFKSLTNPKTFSKLMVYWILSFWHEPCIVSGERKLIVTKSLN